MTVLIRAVISGFGFSLGAALFKKIAKQIGLDDAQDKQGEGAAATEPSDAEMMAADRTIGDLAVP